MQRSHLERGLALASVVFLSTLIQLSALPVAKGAPGGGAGVAATASLSTVVPKHAVRVLVTDVIDGDTLVVRMNGRSEKVRLKGVDTPETVHPHKPVQPWGKAASHFSKDQLGHKHVWIETAKGGAKHDMFGRLLAFVWMEDGTCHNETLVAKGLARVNKRYKFDRLDEYEAIERAARKAKRGIWS